MTAVELTAEEAVAAIKASPHIFDEGAGYEPCPHCGQQYPTTKVQRIHTRSRSGFGAVWDLDDAVAFVARATRAAWVGEMTGHCLAVIAPDVDVRGRPQERLIYFDVPHPEGGPR